MLYDAASCLHRVHLDLRGDPSARDEISAFVEMLWSEGAAHEVAILAQVPADTVDLRAAPTADRRELTRQAMSAGAPLILGGELSSEGMLARPDVLRRDGGAYVPGDVKAGSATDGRGRPKAAYANQVALSADLLIRSGRLDARRGFIWDRNGTEVDYDLDLPQGTRSPATPWDVYRKTLHEVVGVLEERVATRPAAQAACKLCRWRSHCHAELVRSDDPTLVAQLGRSARDALAAKVRTVTDLATLDLSSVVRPGGRTVFPGVGAARLARFRDRARLLCEAGAHAYARQPLPIARAANELFLDIEVDPFGDRTYLHGILSRSRLADGEDERFTAHLMAGDGLDEERRAFADAWAQLTADPNAVVYYWSPYERTMYRALQARHPDVCTAEQVEAFFARPRTIDLLNDVVAPMTDWPLHDYSIKTIAKHLGFRWRDAEPSGAASIEWYRRWLQTGETNVRDRIVDYNEDDCIATRVVLDALLELPVRQAEAASW
jgi:predicted RecB family nuclease